MSGIGVICRYPLWLGSGFPPVHSAVVPGPAQRRVAAAHCGHGRRQGSPISGQHYREAFLQILNEIPGNL